MLIELHKSSIWQVPSLFNDVSYIKIKNDTGNLIALAVEHGGVVVVSTASDPDFVQFCAQYGISAKSAEKINL